MPPRTAPHLCPDLRALPFLPLRPCDRRQVHRQQHAGLRQFADRDHRPRRAMRAHDLGIGRVHRLEVRHGLEEDVDVHDMVQVGADRFQHYPERRQDLPRLCRNVRSSQLPRRRIDAGRATNPDVLADLGDVIYGPIGVGVFGGVSVSTRVVIARPSTWLTSRPGLSKQPVRLQRPSRVAHSAPATGGSESVQTQYALPPMPGLAGDTVRFRALGEPAAAAMPAALESPRRRPVDMAVFGLRVLEASNQPGRSLHMVLERGGQLFPGQAGLQRFRVEVGGDQRPGVVMPVGIRRGAWAEINRLLHCALAADKFVGGLAQLAFGEPLYVCRDAINHHVRHAGRGTTFGIEQQEHEALGALWHARPGERRRDVLADAIRGSLLVAAGIFDRERAVVLNLWRGQRQRIRFGGADR